jgi:hypothetical protein
VFLIQGWRALLFGGGLRLSLFFLESQALGLRLSSKKNYVLNATLSKHNSYLYSYRVRKSALRNLKTQT